MHWDSEKTDEKTTVEVVNGTEDILEGNVKVADGIKGKITYASGSECRIGMPAMFQLFLMDLGDIPRPGLTGPGRYFMAQLEIWS